MTENQKKECNKIIHTASVAAGGAGMGLAQIPGGDRVLITPIQVIMTIKLAKVFDINLTESEATTSLLTSGIASTVGRTIAKAIVGRIPVLGNAINAATAVTITEALGWTIAKDFDSGKIVDNLLLVKDVVDSNK